MDRIIVGQHENFDLLVVWPKSFLHGENGTDFLQWKIPCGH